MKIYINGKRQISKKDGATNRTRKGRFGWKRGGLKLAIGLGIALLLALAIWWFDEPIIVSPLPEEPEYVSPVSENTETRFTARIVPVRTLTWREVVDQILAEWADVHPDPNKAKVFTKQALEVFFCESGWREDAEHVNTDGTVDLGIAQINSVHGYSRHELLAARNNIRIAKELFVKSGYSWKPWVCARKLGYI